MSGQQAFFAALFDPDLPPPAGLLAWNGSDPAVRFAVYRNNVIVSLIDALADTFPVTQELVGEEFFRAMARVFVRQEPPRSRVLAFYGESLPDFIERFPPAATLPYLADVARLEFQRVRAYHAADADRISVDAIAQALADPDTLPGTVIALHPSVAVMRSNFSVLSVWAAHQGVIDISSVDPCRPEIVLIVRPQLDVETIRLTAAAGDFIALLLRGENFGSATEQTSQTHPDFALTETLSLLIQKQAISSISPSGRALA